MGGRHIKSAEASRSLVAASQDLQSWVGWISTNGSPEPDDIEAVCGKLEDAIAKVREAKQHLRDWKQAVREAMRERDRKDRAAAHPGGGTCTVVFGGEAFTVPEGADIETRKGVLLVNGSYVTTKWPGAAISMGGGTFGNVSLS